MTLVLTDSDKNAHFLKSVFMYHCIHTWIYLVLFFGFIWILRLFILWPPPQLLPARTTIYFIKFILVLWKESPAAHHSVVRRVNTEGPWKATTISSAMERRKKGKRGIHYSGFEMASAVSWSSWVGGWERKDITWAWAVFIPPPKHFEMWPSWLWRGAVKPAAWY